MNQEPKWRQVLNWSAVIAFFSMPSLFFSLQLLAIEFPGLHFEEHLRDFSWTRDYFKMIVLLVFGLAGINSWDRRNGGKS